MNKSARDFRDERDKLNSQVKEIISKCREISVNIGEMHKIYTSSRKKESVIANIVFKLQKDFTKLKDKKKKLAKDKASVSGNIKNISSEELRESNNLLKEMKRLDWIVQTEVLSSKKEDELSRKVIALEKQLAHFENYRKIHEKTCKIEEKINKINYMYDIYTDIITDALDKKHELKNENLKQIKKLKKEHILLKKTNKMLNEKKTESNEMHEKYVARIKEEKAEKEREKKRIIKDMKKAKDEELKDIEKARDSLFEELKKKKKITL